MRLIPWRMILMISLLVGIFSYGVMTLAIEDTPSDAPTEQGDQYNTGDTPAIERAEDASLSSPPITMKMIIPSIIFLFSTMLLSLGYYSILNSDGIQKKVNNSLRLAGYSKRIGHLGRSWELSDGVMIILLPASPVEFYISAPSHEGMEDPRKFGLRSEKNRAVTQCSADTLQLTLQSIRRYMKKSSEAQM